MKHYHDYVTRELNGQLLDFKNCKWEVCAICGDKVKWKKDTKGRVDNTEYLKAHLRNFCQPWGRTRKDFIRIYHPQMSKIKLCLSKKCAKKNICTHVSAETDYTKKAFKIDQKGSNEKSWRKEIYGI